MKHELNPNTMCCSLCGKRSNEFNASDVDCPGHTGLRDNGMIVNRADRLDGNVTIARSRYEQLLLAESKLDALEAGGVDNWCGYDEAMAAASGEG